MFIEFFYLLRKRGLKVSLNEWMALMEALNQGPVSYTHLVPDLKNG